MNATSQSDTPSPEAMEAIVRSAHSLYSLPAIAAEVLELTSSPKVDARALKDCIEVDPALTAKILRVVNSSMFGLSREVSDLNQAIALLGTKPLKLLVLGFSLPENLFVDIARKQLDWYWNRTLARAVAAREISEMFWDRPGDDAFLAGLLQDLGILVLLGEFKESYSPLLEKAIDQQANLSRLEVDSLGFDHAGLSAALLEHWNMPKQLVGAISEPREQASLLRKQTPVAELARILHLAELVTELVAEKQLRALADLMEIGEAYCGLNKELLHELVARLQPKVEQLAEVFSLDSVEGDYLELLAEAHSLTSEIVEEVAEPLSRMKWTEEQAGAEILSEVTRLRTAVDQLVSSPTVNPVSDNVASEVAEIEAGSGPPQTEAQSSDSLLATLQVGVSFTDRLTLAVGRSRSRREPISVLVLELSAEGDQRFQHEEVISKVLESVCRDLEGHGVFVEKVADGQRAVILPDYDRQEAVRYANEIVCRAEQAVERLEAMGATTGLSIGVGVAAVSLPVKNFPPLDLIETAERCLAAARSSDSSVVKSLEIY